MRGDGGDGFGYNVGEGILGTGKMNDISSLDCIRKCRNCGLTAIVIGTLPYKAATGTPLIFWFPQF